MRFEGFDWDGRNVEPIAHHGLEPNDVEEACRSSPLVLRGRSGRYVAYGRAGGGRYLLVVLYALGQHRARVITARDMTPAERRFYQRRH